MRRGLQVFRLQGACSPASIARKGSAASDARQHNLEQVYTAGNDGYHSYIE